jgi:hypothetical protein
MTAADRMAMMMERRRTSEMPHTVVAAFFPGAVDSGDAVYAASPPASAPATGPVTPPTAALFPASEYVPVVLYAPPALGYVSLLP